MQSTGSDYYQRAAKCCPARTMANQDAIRIPASMRGAELLCCCCSCSTATTGKTPGLLASLGVCVLVLGYTLLGAFAFMALEGGLKSEPPTEVVSTKVDSESSSSSTISLKEDNTAIELRARTVERLWSLTEDLNVLYKENWTRLAAREVLEFQKSLVHGLRRPISPSIYEPVSTRRRDPLDRRMHLRRWTFSSSLLYSLTLITTIGYGSVAPRTIWGRLITIVYALAGIPLMLVYLSTVGDVLARSFRRMYGRICRPRNCTRKQPPPPPPPVSGIMGKTYRYDNHVENKSSFYSASKDSSCDDLGTRSTGSAILLDCASDGLLQAATSSTTALQDVTENGKRHFHPCSLSLSSGSSQAYAGDLASTVRVPILLCLMIILLYICAGAVMFNRLEGWSLLEGSYFCFTSLGTIGFGDLVPVGRNANTVTFEELSLCACSLYILVGMGLIAMCFNLVQEEVVRAVKVFGKSCGMSTGMTVSGQIGGPGSIGVKSEPEDCLGSNDSRLSEQDEEGIAMSVVSAS